MLKRNKGTLALIFVCMCLSLRSFTQSTTTAVHIIHPVAIQKVKIEDPFWSPRFMVWQTKTVYDVFNKMEGSYEPDRRI